MSKLARRASAVREEADVIELISNFGKSFWDDVARRVGVLVKQLVEQCLEAKRNEILKARSYERTEARAGYRGGTYPRRIKTRWGDIEVRVPRLAEGAYNLDIIDRFGRRQVEVDEVIGRLFLAGCSTRRLHDIAEQLYGWGLGRSTVSSITKSLDAEVRAFRDKPIADTVRYLLLDGIHGKVREIGAEHKVFLVAYGIHTDGRREILGFVLADSESAAAWRDLLADLKGRGLRGKKLWLITLDGNKGLLKAVKDIYPLKPVQRCVMHKIRNVMATCRVRNKGPVAASLRPIWGAKNRRQALRAVAEFERRWIVEEERAVKTLRRDLAHCLTFLDFPEQDHKMIRTTNRLERAFREVRRRTRPMGTYVTKDSAERIMFGITDTMNRNWSGTPRLTKSAT
jgi:transposase-like protein